MMNSANPDCVNLFNTPLTSPVTQASQPYSNHQALPDPSASPSSIVPSQVSSEIDAQELPADWTQRPEAVVLILFATVLLLWQMYLDLSEIDVENSLSGRKLAERLGVSYSTISRRKVQESFSNWSKSLDPDGIAWVYSDGRFMPLFQ